MLPLFMQICIQKYQNAVNRERNWTVNSNVVSMEISQATQAISSDDFQEPVTACTLPRKSISSGDLAEKLLLQPVKRLSTLSVKGSTLRILPRRRRSSGLFKR